MLNSTFTNDSCGGEWHTLIPPYNSRTKNIERFFEDLSGLQSELEGFGSAGDTSEISLALE